MKIKNKLSKTEVKMGTYKKDKKDKSKGKGSKK